MSQLFDQDSNVGNGDNLTAEQAMELLVGEGKKYSTPAELAKAYSHANQHIGRLEADIAELRVKAESAKSVDEILAQLKGTPPNNNIPPITPAADDDDTLDINELVSKAVEQRLQKDSAQSNTQKVIDAVKATFGSRAKEVYDAKEKELGINLDELAARSPQAVLALLGAKSTPSNSAPSLTGDTRHEEGATPRDGTDAYYEHLYTTGKISREQKFRMKHQALDKFGADHFFSQRSKK